MSNPAPGPSDVISDADKLMRSLLETAGEEDTPLDTRLQIMQAATRWIAVKNRMNVPEEGNAFDGWRSAVAGGGSTAAGAADTGVTARANSTETEGRSGERASVGRKKGRRNVGSSRTATASNGGGSGGPVVRLTAAGS